MIDAAKLNNKNKYDYTTWFQFLTPYVEKSDFALANLEVTLSGPPCDQYKNGGIGVELGLSVVDGKVKFSSWSFLPFWVRVSKSPKGFFLIPVSDWEKNQKKYDLDSEEIIKINQFGSDTRSLLHEINEMK